MVNYWQNQNSDYAVAQPGSADAGEAALILGAKSGQATYYSWKDLRQRWGLDNGRYAGVFDDFLGAALSTRWATNLATGATIAINSQVGGAIRFTTDTDDNDHATLALGLNFQVSNGWTWFEARVKSVTAITLRAIEVGVSDALSETAGLAFSNHSAAGVTAVADNAAIFGYDTDAAMTAWAINTVKATAAQGFAVTTAPALTYQTLAIGISADGTAVFYLDGTLIRRVENAVATTAILTPWISLVSLSGATKSIDVDYVFISGERT